MTLTLLDIADFIHPCPKGGEAMDGPPPQGPVCTIFPAETPAEICPRCGYPSLGGCQEACRKCGFKENCGEGVG